MTRASPPRQSLLSQSRLNLAAFAVSLIANVLTIPLAIGAIGLSQFGSAGLVLALLAPFSVVGVVMGQALIREIPAALGRSDPSGAARSFWACLKYAALGAVSLVLLAALGGVPALEAMSSGELTQRDWGTPLWLAVMAWLFQQGCFILQAVLAALQNFRWLAVSNGVGAIVSAFCVVCFSRAMSSDAGFLLGTATGFGVTLLLLALVTRSCAPWLGGPAQVAPKEAGEILGFARWQAAAHFAGGTANQVDRYVLASVAPLSVVGQYNVAMRLQEVVHMGVLKAAEVLFPHFSVTASQPRKERADFFARANWVIGGVSVMALAPLIPCAQPLIELWVSAQSTEFGAPMLRTLATAGVVGSGFNVFTYFALATNHAQKLAYINLAHSMLLVVLAVPMIAGIGPLGAGIAYVIGNVGRLMAGILVSAQDFSGDVGRSRFLVSTLLPVVTGLAVAWLLHATMPEIHSWIGLGLTYIIAMTLVGLSVLGATLVFGDGRQLVAQVSASLRRPVEGA